jgi:hypothetical protein
MNFAHDSEFRTGLYPITCAFKSVRVTIESIVRSRVHPVPNVCKRVAHAFAECNDLSRSVVMTAPSESDDVSTIELIMNSIFLKRATPFRYH